MSATFKETIHKAVSNGTLTKALGNFSTAYLTSRARAYEGIDFEAVRNRIAVIKSSAAGQLDALAQKFDESATAKGATVFHANSSEAVRAYILQLAEARGVKKIVKSKSMATEEIHLNQHLEKAGIDVRETDLGEWILQLDGQRPSHMVMPAIHMTKEEVSDVFSDKVEEGQTPDISKLVAFARQKMRPAFLEAQMGITGANIAVAETGSIVLVTNEGNARQVSTLPNIQVVVLGLEKLIENFADIEPILTALPRSATGQLLTSYVSIITGPTPNTDGSKKELHIILMDNRRNEMAHDGEFKQALQCIRCASCLNVCPVYSLVGGHVFGKVYTGGIGTILTAWFDTLKQSEEIQSLCINCGKCNEVCPGKIDISGLILELRRRLVVEKGLPLMQKAIFQVVNNRRLFHSMLRAASIGQKPVQSGEFIRHLPFFLSGMTKNRSLPAIAAVPFRDQIKKIKQPKCKEKAVFYGGCLIDFAYPHLGEALVRVLNKAGVEVAFPENQTCCGAPARYSGDYEVAAQNSVDNINALLEDEAKYIVSACPTCTVALKEDFQKNLKATGREGHLERAKRVEEKTIDLTSLVYKLVGEGRLKFKEGVEPTRFTYHDSCHYKRSLKAEKLPRELMQKAGHELVEMQDSDRCCGMGGSYTLKMPEISAPMLDQKLVNIEKTGAPLVMIDCPGCVMQIGGGLDKRGSKISVKHTIQMLDECLEAVE